MDAPVPMGGGLGYTGLHDRSPPSGRFVRKGEGFNAKAFGRYDADTTGGAYNILVPRRMWDGTWMVFGDFKGQWDTNAATLTSPDGTQFKMADQAAATTFPLNRKAVIVTVKYSVDSGYWEISYGGA